MQTSHDARIQNERDFHNARYEEESRAGLDQFYEALSDGFAAHDRLIRGCAKDRVVLEYGCAMGSLAVALAPMCKEIHGIDISDVGIARATELAQRSGATNASFTVMNAEDMSFPDETFDLVFGSGIIHHLDLKRCYAEVARVLKPNGCAAFFEPLGHNPVVNLYRRLSPRMRTADEHPLVMTDVELARNYFAEVSTTMFGLTSPASALAKRLTIGRAVRSMLQSLDRSLFRIPSVRRNAWFTLMYMVK